MALRGSAMCVLLAGCALLLLVAQAGRKLALFAQRGESTDAFFNISFHLVASKLALNLHASGPFLTWFIHQPHLKGTFSMQANTRAMFTCHFPSESFISLQPQGPQHQPKLNMGLKLYTGHPPSPAIPAAGEGCVCVSVHARVCAHKTRCVLSRINKVIQNVTKWTIYGQFQQLVKPKKWGGSVLKPHCFVYFKKATGSSSWWAKILRGGN